MGQAAVYEHANKPISATVHRARNTKRGAQYGSGHGQDPLLKEMAQKAVNSGQPILDWNDFIPVYAKTPCVGVHSVAGAVSCTQDTAAGISQGFAKICKSA